MSLATRCTSCGTVFRVVQDQLKVSEGWVRCGRCETVFNALQGLFDLEHDASQRPARPDAGAAAPPPPRWSSAQTNDLPSTHEDDAIESRFFSTERDAPLTARQPAAANPPSRWGAAAPAKAQDSEPPDFVDARFPSELPLDAADDDLPSAIDLDAPLPAAWRETPEVAAPPARVSWWSATWASLRERQRARQRARDTAGSGPDTAVPTPSELGPESLTDSLSPSMLDVLTDAAPLGRRTDPPGRSSVAGGKASTSATPDFVRQAERAARWQRPRVRASLGVAAVLLVGALGMQALVEFRNGFAAEWPASRPLVEALCGVVDCRIEPLQRLSALSVEASGLTQSPANGSYRLSLTLRNRGTVELAMPTVELSVTDAAGGLISRRAIAPSDWRTAAGPPSRQDPASSRASSLSVAAASESQLQLVFATDGALVSGYTVELFYP